MTRTKGYILCIACLMLVLHACKKETTEENIAPELAIPIGINSIEWDDFFLLYSFPVDFVNPVTDLPYWLIFQQLPYSYNFPFGYDRIFKDYITIESMTFRVNVWNEFPLPFVVESINLTSSGHMIIQSLLLPGNKITIPASRVDQLGKVLDKPHVMLDIPFPGFNHPSIQQVRNIRVTGYLEIAGADTSALSFFPSYSIDYQLGLRAKVIIDPGIN